MGTYALRTYISSLSHELKWMKVNETHTYTDTHILKHRYIKTSLNWDIHIFVVI